MNDLISVIVPVYKAELFLEKAVDSILKQSYKNLEIILVDDGSPDRCPYICDDYREKDNRIRVIHKSNGGLSDARNKGLDIATGKYIIFFDDDDILNERFIEILYSICEKNNCDIAQCDFLMTDEDSFLLPPQKEKCVKVLNPEEVMKDFCTDANLVKYWVVWNKIYKRELFDDIRFPVGKNHEDMFTTYKVLWKSRKTAVTNLYLHYYFQRGSSMTGKAMSIQERLDVIEALKDEMLFMKERGLVQEYAFFLLKYYHTIIETSCNIDTYIGFDTDPSYFSGVMRGYQEHACALKKEIINMPQKGMLTNIRTIYPTLEPEEKENLKKIYGERIEQKLVISFSFPISKISEKDRVAIYGAGNVGCSFYSQIMDNDLCNLVLWVDNGFKNHIRKGLPVQPIDRLIKCQFDKIVVAVQNRDVAAEIRENLVGWGIDDKKIIIDLPVSVDKGSKMLAEFENDTRLIQCGGNKRRWILMNTPDHDNLGDHLLTIATLRYLEKYFPDDEVIEVTGRQWDSCQNKIVSKITSYDVICIVGGGFMGDLWPNQDARVKEILDTFSDNKIIFFPQTFYYSHDDKSVLAGDISRYNDNKNILFIHRESNSYNFFINNVVKKEERNACFPDMALFLNLPEVCKEREGILVCLRMDKESVCENARHELYRIIKESGNEMQLIDTVLDRSVLKSERMIEVQALLDKISNAQLLVTDRLHAMIMALLTGTPCIVYDNLSKKVSGVYDWIKDQDFITCINSNEMNLSVLQEYIAKKNNSFSRQCVMKKFSEMYEKICDWLDNE